jgi:3-phenylpropionate/trans-cinnamate dioxygenase ferredoxin reductase subunit
MPEVLSVDGSVTIVGASLAGLRCAETLRQQGFTGTISMIGAETHAPYDRPPLSKQVLAGTWPSEKVFLADDTKLADLHLDLRLGVRATGLDAATREVTLADGTTVQSDAVVIATGASLRQFPGTEGMPGVHGLRTLNDAIALRDDLASLAPGSRVVLIGAGFIGQEVATAAVAMGHDVTILEGLALPLSPIVGEPVAELLLELHRSSGVTLWTGVRVTGIDAPRDGARAGLVAVEGHQPMPADLVVIGIGVVPATGWLEGSGLQIDNGVVTDERLFAAPGIAAIGDVARFRWLGSGHDDLVRIEHWQMAVDHGVHAAKALLLGKSAAPVFDAVPYFWSDQWGKKIQVLGHPSPDDTAEIVIAPDEEGRFLALFHSGSFFTGVLAVSKPRQLMGFRALLARGATIDEAMRVEL